MKNLRRKSIFSLITLFTFVIIMSIGCYMTDDVATTDDSGDEISVDANLTFTPIDVDQCKKDCNADYPAGKERRQCKKACDVVQCKKDCNEDYPAGKERRQCKIQCEDFIQHRPVCKFIGTRSEGWYWQNTSELIKWDRCEEKTARCINIGTRSEGWDIIVDGFVLFDLCAEEEGIERPMY